MYMENRCHFLEFDISNNNLKFNLSDASIEDLLMDKNIIEKLKGILVKHKDRTNYEISQIVNEISSFLSS